MDNLRDNFEPKFKENANKAIVGCDLDPIMFEHPMFRVVYYSSFFVNDKVLPEKYRVSVQNDGKTVIISSFDEDGMYRECEYSCVTIELVDVEGEKNWLKVTNGKYTYHQKCGPEYRDVYSRDRQSGQYFLTKDARFFNPGGIEMFHSHFEDKYIPLPSDCINLHNDAVLAMISDDFRNIKLEYGVLPQMDRMGKNGGLNFVKRSLDNLGLIEFEKSNGNNGIEKGLFLSGVSISGMLPYMQFSWVYPVKIEADSFNNLLYNGLTYEQLSDKAAEDFRLSLDSYRNHFFPKNGTPLFGTNTEIDYVGMLAYLSEVAASYKRQGKSSSI